ncbi:MAG: SdpI family protein, partial [Anaerolineae bacterium]|nr:SdpI family protein [Anaerolineae bacterium]
MSRRITLLIVVLFSLAALGVSLWADPQLGDRIPSHWNAAGQVDGYSDSFGGLYLLPIVIFGLGLLLVFIPSIDPLRANVDKFRGAYHWVIVGMSVYFLYLHVLIVLAALGAGFNMVTMMLPAMGVLFFGLGFMVERSKPNWFIGIRTPWTLMSPTVWEKTHRLGGWIFKIGGVLIGISEFLPAEASMTLLMVSTLGMAL